MSSSIWVLTGVFFQQLHLSRNSLGQYITRLGKKRFYMAMGLTEVHWVSGSF
jgi:hypothetical protein